MCTLVFSRDFFTQPSTDKRDSWFRISVAAFPVICLDTFATVYKATYKLPICPCVSLRIQTILEVNNRIGRKLLKAVALSHWQVRYNVTMVRVQLFVSTKALFKSARPADVDNPYQLLDSIVRSAKVTNGVKLFSGDPCKSKFDTCNCFLCSCFQLVQVLANYSPGCQNADLKLTNSVMKFRK